MASIFQRYGGIYYLQYYLNGVLKRKSLGTKNKDAAKKLLRQFEDHSEQVNLGLIDAAIVPAKAFEKYLLGKTIKSNVVTRYRQMWRWVEAYLAKRQIQHLNDLTSSIVAEYPNWRDCSRKTTREELRLLKSVVAWLVDNGHLRTSPVGTWPKVKTPTKKPETIGSYSKIEVDQILEHFKNHPGGSALTFLAFSGARRGEMEALVVADVDLAAGQIILLSGKTATMTSNQRRLVEIHPRLFPVLKTAVQGKGPKEPVFSETRKHRPAWLTQLLETACRHLKIQYRRVHGLRHFWITSMLSAGVPLAVVMKMAGHSNLSTTQKYLHLGDEHRGWVGRI